MHLTPILLSISHLGPSNQSDPFFDIIPSDALRAPPLVSPRRHQPRIRLLVTVSTSTTASCISLSPSHPSLHQIVDVRPHLWLYQYPSQHLLIQLARVQAHQKACLSPFQESEVGHTAQCNRHTKAETVVLELGVRPQWTRLIANIGVVRIRVVPLPVLVF